MVAFDAQATAVTGLLKALDDSNTDIYRRTDQEESILIIYTPQHTVTAT